MPPGAGLSNGRLHDAWREVREERVATTDDMVNLCAARERLGTVSCEVVSVIA